MAVEVLKETRNPQSSELHALGRPYDRESGYKWEMLALLWFAFFLNQADRAIFGVVLPLIRVDLGLTSAQEGLIASILFWTLAVMVPFAGYIGDVFNKRWIISSCLAFWSVATVFTGMARTAMHLVMFRSVATGGGEAFYAPAANALIGQYHHKTRSLALSIHQTSLYVGVILSGFLGGYMGERWGWGAPFYVFGAVGIFLAVVMAVRLRDASAKDDRSELCDSDAAISGPMAVSLRSAAAVLFRTPTALLLTVAFTGIVFVTNGYMVWSPTFLYEKFDMSLSEAGGFSMFFHFGFALIGVLIGGRLSDLWVEHRRRFRLELQCLSLLLGAPFIVLMGLGNERTTIYLGMAGFGFFRGIFEANTYASLYDVIEPRLRSSASGIMIMLAFLVGAFSPWVLGLFKPTLGLAWGLASLSIVFLIGGTAVFIAARFFFMGDYHAEHFDTSGQN